MSVLRIRSIEIDEGFLAGFNEQLKEHLNCVIGSRGSGKTTLLEFVRFALKISVADESTLDRLVRKNLKAGRVRLEVETSEGNLIVERRARSAPKVLDQEGRLLHKPPEGVLGSGAYVYSQSEIENMASKPMDRLALIDRFAVQDLEVVEATLARLDRQLVISAAQLQNTHGELGDVEALQKDLQFAKVRRRELNQAEVDTGEELQRETAAASARADEERAVKSLEQSARRAQQATRACLERVTEALRPVKLKASPNTDLTDRLQEAQERLRSELERHLTAATEAVDGFFEQLHDAGNTLAERHHEQGAAYSELLKQHAAAQETAAAILEADEAVAVLEAKVAEQELRLQTMAEQLSSRRDLIARLSEARDRRQDARRAAASFLNEKLEDAGIRVSFEEGVDTTAFERALTQFYRGTGESGQKRILAAIVARLTPIEFARLVTERNSKELASLAQIDLVEAEWVVRHLRGKPEHYEIEVLDQPAVPTISFQDGATWKKSDELSTGQKFSAILPILLLQGSEPLICDEPESHLDQDTLMQKVVKPIRDLAGERQLIFATHNANIVVLGDVGNTHVMVLESNGQAASVVRAGSVDDTKEEIGALLEGGHEAFRKRARRYGGKYDPSR